MAAALTTCSERPRSAAKSLPTHGLASRMLARGKLIHAKSTLMNWCVSNIKIEPTATAIKATKQNAGDAKIDPAMALFDAVTVMITNPEAKQSASVYETQDLMMV